MSQTKEILTYLQEGKHITPLEALNKFGCFRLGARIYDLKHEGHDIVGEVMMDYRTNKRFASYYLKERLN